MIPTSVELCAKTIGCTHQCRFTGSAPEWLGWRAGSTSPCSLAAGAVAVLYAGRDGYAV